MIQKSTRFNLFTIQIILVCAVVGCSKNETIQGDKPNNQLNVKEMVMGFFDNMSENDTLFLYENLSQCLVTRNERCVITKENRDIMVSSKIKSHIIDDDSIQLPKTKYIKLENDTFNLESYFLFLFRNNYLVKGERGHVVCSFVYKKNRIRFYSHCLSDTGENSNYYRLVMHNIYSKEERYIPFELVIVPMPADTTVTLLDIVTGN